jgi:hypothetical protein
MLSQHLEHYDVTPHEGNTDNKQLLHDIDDATLHLAASAARIFSQQFAQWSNTS